MSEENEQAQGMEEQEELQEEAVENEDNSSEEGESEDETVTISKKDFKALDRKARAYDATKPPKKETTEKTPETGSIVRTVTALQGLAPDEIETMESEANSLSVPLLDYIKSSSGKAVLNSIRQEKKSRDASPSMNTKSPIYKKHSADDLAKMSSQELEAILPHD